MKYSKLAWFVVALAGIFVFSQYLTINQLREQLSAEDQTLRAISADIEKSAIEHLRLRERIADLEAQLLIAASPTTTPSNRTFERDISEGDSANQEETNFDEERFTRMDDGGYRLNIPTGDPAVTTWKTTEELKSSIDGLNEELSLTISRQGEEFQSKDISAYNDFLDSININEASQQNILAQLIEANEDGFTRTLHRAVEKQANGLVAFITSRTYEDGYDQLMLDLSPAGVMGRNLDPEQLNAFYEFDADRLSQGGESPDYIAQLVETLGI